MVVFAALDKGMWTEITERDFARFSRMGKTMNMQTKTEVVVYNPFANPMKYDVYIDGELYAWCRPVDNKSPDRRVFVV